MSLLKSLFAWFVILVLAVANGALREAVLIPLLGKVSALVLSGALLSLAIIVVAYVLVRGASNASFSRSLLVGILWLALTLAFEFSFGLYVQRKPLPEVLEAYTFGEGNIWPVVLLVTLLAPLFATLLNSRRSHASSRALHLPKDRS